MIQFIEVTNRNIDGGKPVLVGLRYIKRIKAETDGAAVLFIDCDGALWCKESYDEVCAALGAHHRQP